MRYMSEETRGVAYPLWERVRRELALRGWSGTLLNQKTGVARSTINKFRTQPRPPQAATVIALAKALDIPVAEALHLAGILTPEEARSAGDLGQAAEKWAQEQDEDEDDA